ncbi:MAG: hypothetical protein K2M14_03250 [Muribaculaceae bacterium]|nr:hypothetical protein [Muribaculaceae bacterium]
MKNKKNKKQSANILAYRDEADRSYGLAGMSIGLASLDALDRVAYISIDSEGPMVEFTGEYYYGGSPSVSPKAAWRRMIDNYRLTSTLAVGNILARTLVQEGNNDPTDMLNELFETIRLEGREVCQLEEDELDNFINNIVGRSHRVFGNQRLYPAVQALADLLRKERILTGRALAEEMHMLRII